MTLMSSQSLHPASFPDGLNQRVSVYIEESHANQEKRNIITNCIYWLFNLYAINISNLLH
jgi:hypothetical protein